MQITTPRQRQAPEPQTSDHRETQNINGTGATRENEGLAFTNNHSYSKPHVEQPRHYRVENSNKFEYNSDNALLPTRVNEAYHGNIESRMETQSNSKYHVNNTAPLSGLSHNQYGTESSDKVLTHTEVLYTRNQDLNENSILPGSVSETPAVAVSPRSTPRMPQQQVMESTRENRLTEGDGERQTASRRGVEISSSDVRTVYESFRGMINGKSQGTSNDGTRDVSGILGKKIIQRYDFSTW